MVPLVFFDGDGEREMLIGNVEINPTLDYKPFQIILSKKMKISSKHISIHRVHRKHPEATFTVDRRPTKINNAKLNFGLICRHNDCCFLIVFKRYQRWGTFSGLVDFLPDIRYFPIPPRMRLMPEKMVLVRRNNQCVELTDFFAERFLTLPPRMRLKAVNTVLIRRNHQCPDFYVLPPRMRLTPKNHQVALYDEITQLELADLRVQNDQEMSMENFYSGHCMDMENETGNLFCEECENEVKKGNTTSFHHCVKDTVIIQFTTKLGPIKRIIS